MYLKTQGLVLREVAYKDTDKLLTVLTRDYGKMTLKARGVRRSGISRLKTKSIRMASTLPSRQPSMLPPTVMPSSLVSAST